MKGARGSPAFRQTTRFRVNIIAGTGTQAKGLGAYKGIMQSDRQRKGGRSGEFGTTESPLYSEGSQGRNGGKGQPDLKKNIGGLSVRERGDTNAGDPPIFIGLSEPRGRRAWKNSKTRGEGVPPRM